VNIIEELVKAGVDPVLIQKVHDALKEAYVYGLYPPDPIPDPPIQQPASISPDFQPPTRIWM